jgi:hypothetical protein
MANEEHLAILKQGVEAWNRWRDENPDICPELRSASLARMHLDGVNLSRADLRDTNLTRALLCEADLTNAILHRTNFRRADLCQTDFHEADLYEVFFISTNLTGAKGLDSCNHHGPCTLDHRTLVQSGKLPLAFLRGCGLPDSLIEYFPTLLNEPIQRHSVFISYSHQDEPFAKRLHDALQGKGVRCWYAPEDIQGGRKIHEQIDEAVQGYDRLLLIVSDHSMQSEWVKTEIANARRREVQENRRLLFPIRLVDFEVIRNWTCFDADTGKDSAREIREYFIPDFSNWQDHDSFEHAFDRLLRDLKADETKRNG